jgi:hypothetical protein
MRSGQISNIHSPEDLGRIPGTDWIVTSGYDPNSPSHFVNVVTREVREAYPANCTFELDEETYGDIPQPEATFLHGLHIREGADGVHTLYNVNHPVANEDGTLSGRESVEIFEIHVDDEGPRLVWVGALLCASWVFGNEVVAIPGGGVALTNFCFGAVEGFPLVVGQGPSGHILEWYNKTDGWKIVQGSDFNGPNGLEVSPDGKTYFIACWGTKEFARIDRDDPNGTRRSVYMGILLDNITWTSRGTMLVTGQDTEPANVLYGWADGEEITYPFQVIEVEPETLDFKVVVDYDGGDVCATTALEVGDEIWVGQTRGDEIVTFARNA